MSSDIQEVSNLKRILCRKKVAEIRKKYYKAEKRVCKKILKYNECDYEFLVKSSFVEFRKRYFSNLYNVINGVVNNSIGSIEEEMSSYISEKKNSRTFEVISLIRSILDRNDIIWALHKEYLEFRILGNMESGHIFVVNNIRVRIAFNFILENNVCNLTNNNIRYCILEDESLPILTP